MKPKKQALPSLFWAGFDLAKETFQMAVWGHQDFQAMELGSSPRVRKAMPEVLAWLRDHAPKGMSLAVVMEATATFAEDVGSWLLDLDPTLRVAIVNPCQTSAFVKSLGFRNKTDDLDAKALAKYGQERNPVAWERPTPAMAILKDLVRTRADLVRARTAMSNRLKDHKRSAETATAALKKVIQNLANQIKALDKAIKAHLKAQTVMHHQVKRCQSIKGIGIVTATTVLAELGDLTRFPRSRMLTAFAGVSPRKKESGTSVHGKTRMCKQGSGRVRAELFMAASNAARFNPDMKATYQNLLKRGKEPREALGAIMRKLLVLMRAVLKADRDWVPRLSA